jgi:hypothetical protein
MDPFIPAPGETVNINVSGSTQSVSLGFRGIRQVRIMNNGSATVWVEFGPTGVTATTGADMPVGPGVTEVVTLPDFGSTAHAAVIAAGATGVVYFTPGVGI